MIQIQHTECMGSTWYTSVSFVYIMNSRSGGVEDRNSRSDGVDDRNSRSVESMTGTHVLVEDRNSPTGPVPHSGADSFDCSARDWDGKDYLRIIPRVVLVEDPRLTKGHCRCTANLCYR